MSSGVYIHATDINPGPLTGVTFVPSTTSVQQTGTVKITLTTSHKLEKDSMIEIRFPAGMTLPAEGTQVKVIKTTDSGNVELQGTVVKGGQYIQVYDVLNDYSGTIPDA